MPWQEPGRNADAGSAGRLGVRLPRGAFQSPLSSRVSLASLSPAVPPPCPDAFSLGGRRLVAFGAPGTSVRGAGGLKAERAQRSLAFQAERRSRKPIESTSPRSASAGLPGLGKGCVGRNQVCVWLYLRAGGRAPAGPPPFHTAQPGSTDLRDPEPARSRQCTSGNTPHTA